MPKKVKKTTAAIVRSDVGPRFKEFRQIVKKTQSEMSEEIEFSQSNLSQIENGSIEPGSGFLKRLATQYPDVNLNWLVTGAGHPTKKDVDKSKDDLNTELRASNRSLLKRVEYLEQENSRLLDIVGKASKTSKRPK